MAKQKLSITTALASARKSAKSGNLERAIQLYEAILKYDSENTEAQIFLSGIKNNRQEPPDDTIDALKVFYIKKEYESCIQECLAKLQSYPKSVNLGNILGSSYNALGRHSDAVEAYSAILGIDPMRAEVFANRGNALESLGQSELALKDYGKALSLNNELVPALINRGNLHHKQGNIERAEADFITAAKVDKNSTHAFFGLGCIYMEKEDFKRAKTSFEKALAIEPNHIEAMMNQAYCLKEMGTQQEAVDVYSRIISIKPDSASAYCGLGETYADLMDSHLALENFERALDCDPKYARAYNSMGKSQIDLGHYQDAICSLREAISIEPSYIFALINLGTALTSVGEYKEAESCLIQAIKQKEHMPEPHNNLGHLYWLQGQYSLAIDLFSRALEINPRYAEAYSNRGNALQALGRLTEAVSDYRNAIAFRENYTTAFSNLLTTLNYIDSFKPEDALHKAKEYGKLVGQLASSKTISKPVLGEGKQLKVGIVSADLRNHPAGYFIEGILRNLKSLTLFAYTTRNKHDDLTKRIKPLFKSWESIQSLSDHDAALAIRNDDIDILIDLSGHTAGNRLPVFAYRPAPIQISWLGYFATTGVPEIDFLISDPFLTPNTLEKYFTEKIIRMTHSRWCFTPPLESPDVSPMPAEKKGAITFGCFNNLTKLNGSVFELWSSVLNKVPGSSLLLKNSQFREKANIKYAQEKFKEFGIENDRLIIEGPEPRNEYLKAFSKVDVALDPFPFTGGATSVEGLWMGVPFITLEGDTMVSRQGVSILKNSGLDEFIARDKKDYIEKAVKVSNNLDQVKEFRKNCRQTLPSHPLFNQMQFAADFEALLIETYKSHSAR